MTIEATYRLQLRYYVVFDICECKVSLIKVAEDTLTHLFEFFVCAIFHDWRLSMLWRVCEWVRPPKIYQQILLWVCTGWRWTETHSRGVCICPVYRRSKVIVHNNKLIVPGSWVDYIKWLLHMCKYSSTPCYPSTSLCEVLSLVATYHWNYRKFGNYL